LAIAKLEQYIDLMEEVPAYWSAMILLPAFRTRWIERFLTPERSAVIIAQFKQLYQEEYEGIAVAYQEAGQPYRQPRPHNEHLVTHDFYDPEPDPTYIDEVAVYLGEPVRPVPNALVWWEENRQRLPRLSTMAFNLLTIPAMSSECERVFSSAKLTVGLKRQSLEDNTINMVECLKHWAKRQ
jgi:hypothetical protein